MSDLCGDNLGEKTSDTFHYFMDLLETNDAWALDTDRIQNMLHTQGPSPPLVSNNHGQGDKVLNMASELYTHGRLMLFDSFCDDFEKIDSISKLKLTRGDVWDMMNTYQNDFYRGFLRLEALHTYDSHKLFELVSYCAKFNEDMQRYMNLYANQTDESKSQQLPLTAAHSECFYKNVAHCAVLANIVFFYSHIVYPTYEAAAARYATIVAENAAKEKEEQKYKMFMQRKDEKIAQGSEDVAKLTQQLDAANRELADNEKQAARNKKNEEKTARIKLDIANLKIHNAQIGVEKWETQAKQLMASLLKQSTVAVVTAQDAFKDAMIARKLDMERINNEQWNSANVDSWNNALDKFKDMSVLTGTRKSGFIPGTTTPVAQHIYLFPRPQDVPGLYNKVAKSLMQNIGLWAAMAGPAGFRDHIAENA
ncbi:hypothetical protein [Nereida ignava]|uniref:hypothetical protein n=1 Tax=Nereida ignava TaxID=282199 RepID=UPI0030F6979A